MQNKISYVEKKPNIEEFKLLRKSVDWDLAELGITDEGANKSLELSPYCVCAYSNKGIVGMVRITGDETMYGYIQDTIVLPEFQGMGVGKTMLELLLENIEGKKGYLLGVCPSKKSVGFYSKYGFRKRPEEPNGFMYKEIR